MNRHLFGSHWGRCSVIVLLTATTWSPRTLSADDPRPTSPPTANPATSAESNERALDARIDQARALLKRDRPEQAARLLEPHLLEWAQLDPTQRIALVNELRACYRGAIQQHRLAGRSHKVDEFEEGLEMLAKLRVAATRQVAPRSSSTRDSATKPNEGRNGLEPPKSPLHDSNLNGLFTDLPTPPTPLEADEPPHPLNRQPRGAKPGIARWTPLHPLPIRRQATRSVTTLMCSRMRIKPKEESILELRNWLRSRTRWAEAASTCAIWSLRCLK